MNFFTDCFNMMLVDYSHINRYFGMENIYQQYLEEEISKDVCKKCGIRYIQLA